MAYLSEITIAHIIEKEHFINACEARKYLEERYPTLFIDESLLRKYFPYVNPKRSFRKRRLLVLSEYLHHNFTYLELFTYLKIKYPMLSFSLPFIMDVLDSAGYSFAISQKLIEKKASVQKKEMGAESKEEDVVTIPTSYLLKENVDTLNHFHLRCLLCAHLALNGCSNEKIAKILSLSLHTVDAIFEHMDNFFMCKEEYVEKIKCLQRKSRETE